MVTSWTQRFEKVDDEGWEDCEDALEVVVCCISHSACSLPCGSVSSRSEKFSSRQTRGRADKLKNLRQNDNAA